MKERETAWMILIGIFGTVGMQLHKQLERRAEKLRSNKDRISNAIKQIE
jgi:homoserine dehydrogenase